MFQKPHIKREFDTPATLSKEYAHNLHCWNNSEQCNNDKCGCDRNQVTVMKLKTIEHTIGGVPYVIRSANLRNNRGECDHPKINNPQIRVSSKLDGVELLEVLIHETMHATGWLVLSEEYVTDAARTIAEIITKQGYKRT